VVDLHRLLEQAAEEKAALARAAAVEGEGELVQVEVELLRADRSLVPSSQRLSSEETRCARGIATWAGRRWRRCSSAGGRIRLW